MKRFEMLRVVKASSGGRAALIYMGTIGELHCK